MYLKVPTCCSSAFSASTAVRRPMPKSVTITLPFPSSSRFAGLMSLCSTPASWACAKAKATGSAIFANSFHESRRNPRLDRFAESSAEVGLAFRRAGWRLVLDPAIAVDHFPAARFDEDKRAQFSGLAERNAVANETLVLFALH